VPAACPGAGTSAALTGHTVRSVGCGAPVRSPLSPAREQGRRHREIDAAGRGCGRRVDLASARVARRRAGNTPGGRCVIRLTDTGPPKVEDMARGQVTPAFCPGTDLDVRLTEASLGRGGRALEAEVQAGAAKHPVPLRLVGVHTPTGDGVFRTHLPPRIGPRPVADRSRVRGEVALRLRVAKSVHRLDEGDAERPCSVTALLQAALSAAMIAALLAPTPKRQTRPPQAGAARPADGPGLRAAGARGRAALGEDRGPPHARWQRSPLAPSASGLGSAPRLEAPTTAGKADSSAQSQGDGLSGHIWLTTYGSIVISLKM
jgi:hypothetical protein